ncbi:sensor histidine kinase [Janthinobacterium sp. Mn2066]|uniref:sensor histidine kinase n=1 Tax=Janthinobacterium sp. Mn2066 TaxID=3395264 RepID=UPI003BD323A2
MKPSSTVASDHPLELIPFFRRWQRGLLRDLIYTLVLGMGFCLLFFGLYAYNLPRHRLLPQLWNDFVIATAIAYSIHGLYALGNMVLAPWLNTMRGWPRAAYHVALPTVGVFSGYFIGILLLNPAALRHVIFTPGIILSFAIVSVLISVVLLFLYWMRERELLAREHLAAEQRRTLEANGRALEAQLRMLQAQIEPHFLYNTLANAVGLIQPAPERARLLLERLIDYLRVTLAASRDSNAPLQREIDAITAYLELMKLRMGERLRYRIALMDEVTSLPLPPMLLQPIVENAISHGLEPKIDGGEIVLTANIEPGYLHILISDTGVGFRASISGKLGGGVGLSNLRERMLALYGKDGKLNITTNAAGGVSVSLFIPLYPHPLAESV